MSRRDAAFVVLLTLCAVAAVIGGQFAVMKHFHNAGRRPAVASNAWESSPFGHVEPLDEESLIDDSPAAIARVDSDSSRDAAATDFDDSLGLIRIASNDEPATGDVPSSEAASVNEGGPLLDGGPASGRLVPDKLPHLDDAAPISDARKRREEQTRAIIAQEMPNATQEERDVWFDELKGLEPPMTRELLRLRKMIRHDPAASLPDFPSLPSLPGVAKIGPTIHPPFDVSAGIPADVISQPHSFTGESLPSSVPAIESSIAALRVARDVVLNNIANAHTTAFRRSRILFEDLPYQHLKLPGQQDADGRLAAVGVAVGFGVQVAGTSVDFTPGRLESTGGRLHLAIVGDGYFQVEDGSQIVYTRCGAFARNADGQLVLSSADRGRAIEPAVVIPADATEIAISNAGIVTVQQPGSSNAVQVGQIQLARFVNSGGLIPLGENLFEASDASGAATVGIPGQLGLGTLRQGYLETSNVDLEEELAEARRLQSRLQALEQARAILDSSIPASAPTARIAETPPR